MEEQIQQAVPLIGQYVLQDFYTDKPYAELYGQKDNKFLQQIMIQKMRDLAVSLGFKGFMTAWKAYMQAQKNDVSVDDDGMDTMFDNQPITLRCGNYSCNERAILEKSRCLSGFDSLLDLFITCQFDSQ